MIAELIEYHLALVDVAEYNAGEDTDDEGDDEGDRVTDRLLAAERAIEAKRASNLQEIGAKLVVAERIAIEERETGERTENVVLALIRSARADVARLSSA
jgi:hypothetical protein